MRRPNGRASHCDIDHTFSNVARAKMIGIAVVFSLAVAVGVAVPSASADQSNPPSGPIAQDDALTLPGHPNVDASIVRSRATGAIRFLVMDPDEPLSVPVARDGATVAMEFFAQFGGEFGVDDTNDALLDSTMVDASGAELLTFSQVHSGLPVFHAMLKVRVATGVVTSVSGTWVPGIAVDPTPTISSEEALRIAVADTDFGGAKPSTTGSPLLGIHRTGLLKDSPGGIARLAYEVRVESLAAGMAEDVYVDASDGRVLDRVDRHPHALDRAVFDGRNRRVWNEGDSNPIVAPAGSVPADVAEWQQAIDHAASFYNLLGSISGRDGPRGGGEKMESRMQQPCSFNAFTDGFSVFVCTGSATDDIIAHEWGHVLSVDVTGFMKSDVDESFADIWGETIDQLNGTGVDEPSALRSDECPDLADPVDPELSKVRWKFAEDLVFAFRDMWNPVCDGGIGKTSDGYDPDGLPHAMAALGNHAFARAVDGGTYEGVPIAPLGITKAVNVWWAAEQLMFPGANFADLAAALTSACASLVGVDVPALSLTSPNIAPSGEVVSPEDCASVESIIDVVEMRDAHPPLLLEQTIAFAPIDHQLLGVTPIALTATASSGLPVTLTSPTTDVCTVVDGLLTMVAEGVCLVVATQEGDAEWAAAAPVRSDFIVGVLIGGLRPKPGESVKRGSVVTVSFQLRDAGGRKIVPSRIEIALMFIGSNPPLVMDYSWATNTFSRSFPVDASFPAGSVIPIEVGVGADGWFVGGAATSVVVKK